MLVLLLLLLSAQVEKTKPLEPETFLTFDYEMNEHEPRSQEKNENFRLCVCSSQSIFFSPRSSHRKKTLVAKSGLFFRVVMHCGFISLLTRINRICPIPTN